VQRSAAGASARDTEVFQGWELMSDKPLKHSESSQQVNPQPFIEDPNLEYIPCLYLPIDDGARKLIIYFHGNAEDIGLAYDFLY
jgi:hypothetical protein